MRSLEPIVLLIMVDHIRDGLLLIEALLVDGVLGEVRLDDVELAKVPAAVAIAARAVELVMVVEV